ncbi:MAG: D-alanyl-D-alanine carboxypeptidase family protein [Tenericutes bacterium]|nr:D-alanyl-D-alanine carboxypeptidase family protein [Mycoplasmatota bacterium]MDD6941494.1 M15 family metallopeptidase [bacterium]MDY2696800.1 M15 family metallopeptidase [Bacilli bacterium]
MKRKKKLKTKNFLVFIIIIILIITSIIYGINKSKNNNTNSKEQNKIENKDKVNDTKELTELEKAKKDLAYYKDEYEDAYKEYREKNKDLSIEKVITNVNIGLNYDYYTHTKATKDLNTNTILVNKYNYLTEDYVPENLQTVDKKYSSKTLQLVDYAKEAFEELSEAASKENYTVLAMSSYRSYQYQYNLYNRYVNTDGIEAADTYSARPGYSEHQTGLAVDVYNGKEDFTNFEKTKEYNWMQDNAYKFGFILRFPKDKVLETGYQYESWHYRYVGKEIAKYIHDNNLCFEEYYATHLIK